MEIGESTGHSNAFSIPPLCTSQYTDMQRYAFTILALSFRILTLVTLILTFAEQQ